MGRKAGTEIPESKVSVTIRPEEFKRRLDREEVGFIFDLRHREEVDSWKIEGRSEIELLNIPQIDFVGEEEKYFDRFPKDREIIAVCAHGDSSHYSAELLNKEGFNALNLEGGMDLWSEFYEVNKVSANPDIYQIYRVSKGCITYIVASEGEAIVIDAVSNTEKILGMIDSLNVKVKYVFDTHLQADHISGGREIAAKTGAVYHINQTDVENAAYEYGSIENGEEFRVGKSVLKAIYSPGHTPGSTSFMLDGKFLFTGDIIMKTSIGRPDLGGMVREWAVELHDTLYRKFGPLPGETVILPSHAASIAEQDKNGVIKTTLEYARKNNALYRLKEIGPFTEHIVASLVENPERYQDIRTVNLGLSYPDEKKRKELEIGKNLCGMATKKDR